MEVEYNLLPDISETLDRPYEKTIWKIAKGGTRIADIKIWVVQKELFKWE